MILNVVQDHWTRGSQLVAKPLLHLCAEPFTDTLFYHIFHAGVLAIGAVSVVALHFYDSFNNRQDLFNAHIAERSRQSWIGFFLAMRHAHATADHQRKARQLLAVQDSHQPDILRINIDAVIAWEGNADLEFARQIGRAVDWLY